MANISTSGRQNQIKQNNKRVKKAPISNKKSKHARLHKESFCIFIFLQIHDYSLWKVKEDKKIDNTHRSNPSRK